MSRTAAYEYLRAHWDAAIRDVLDHPNVRVMLYDIGGGRKGVETAIKFLRALPESVRAVNDRIFIHVSFPVCDATDVDRASAIDRRQDSINVRCSGNVEASAATGRINVCEHRIGECECAAEAGATKVVFISCHTLYYIRQAEYRAIYDLYGPVVIHAAIHRPTPGGQLPVDNPEFVWVSAADAPEVFTWQERVLSRVRASLIGDPFIAMIPLKHAGTVYRHSSMSWLQYGGMHVSVVSSLLDWATAEWTTFVSSSVCIFVPAFLLSLIGCCTQVVWLCWSYYERRSRLAWFYWSFGSALTMPLLGPLLSGPLEWAFVGSAPGVGRPLVIMAAVVSFFGAFVVSARYFFLSARDPGLLTDTTVSFIHRTSLADERQDPLVDILDVSVGPPRPLMPTTFGSVQVDPEMRRHALAILLASPDDVTVMNRTTASLLRRYTYSVSQTVASVKEARRVASLVRDQGNGVVGSGLTQMSTPQPSSIQLSALRRSRLRVWPLVLRWFGVVIVVASVVYWLTAEEPSSWGLRSRTRGW